MDTEKISLTFNKLDGDLPTKDNIWLLLPEFV